MRGCGHDVEIAGVVRQIVAQTLDLEINRDALAVEHRTVLESIARHIIEKQHVEVDVEIQSAAKALDQSDRPGLGRATGEPRLLDPLRGDAAVDDAEHLPHDFGLAREKKTQRVRDAQHPLAHRLLGKHLIDQQLGALRHAPGAAAERPEP